MKAMHKLKLNTNIFTKDHIIKAAEAYKDICKIAITEEDGYIFCEFTDCIYCIDETVKEFENYVIDLMNTDIAV